MAPRGRIAALVLLMMAVGSSVAGCAGATRLQFRPEIGKKQTMRVIFRLATTHPAPAGQDVTEHVWTFTVELEPLAAAPDGSVTMKVGILRVCQESSLANRGKIRHFDSTEGGPESSQYAALLGESFTIVASAQGTLVKLDPDAFYAAMAENRIKDEDRTIKARADLKGQWGYGTEDGKAWRRLVQAEAEKAIQTEVEKAIQAENAKYGSREKRKQAYKEQAYREQAPDFLINNTNLLRTLLTNLLPPLAAQPVKPGDQWTGPVMLLLEGLMELKGTYTFKGSESGVCILQAEARRSLDDQPLDSPSLPVRQAPPAKLVGTYQATIKVDRATGSLLSREAVMELEGTAPMPNARTRTFGDPVPITTKATVTVEPVR